MTIYVRWINTESYEMLTNLGFNIVFVGEVTV